MVNRYFLVLVVFIVLIQFGCQNSNFKENNQDLSISVDTLNESFSVNLELSEDSVHREKASKVQELVERLGKRKQFNGTILIAEKGKIVYQGVEGKARFRPDSELRLNTPFHLASVSKQFTAMAIMMLQEEGKLDYDDKVTKYIPRLPYEKVTIRQLLQHTSGIPSITEYIPQFIRFWDTCKLACNSDVPEILAQNKPGIHFYPDRRFSYNNTGYILLAVLVEKVSGLSYKEFMEKRIFKPLKMKNSFVYDIYNLNNYRDRAYGYNVYRRTFVPDEDDIRNGLVGEKGIYASAIDLYKWDQALYTEKLVNASTLEKAFSRGTLSNGRKIDYGFGWRMPRSEKNIVYHFGHWRGFRTGIVRIMDDEITIIILNNTSSRKLRYMVLRIIDILYSDKPYKPDF